MQIFRFVSILPLALVAVSTPGAALAAQSLPASAAADRLAEQLARPTPSLELQTPALDRLETAVRAWTEGDWLPAAALADSVVALFPTLEDWRPLIYAELLAPTGDTARVSSTLRLLDREGDLWARWGWVALVDALEEAGDLEAARSAARAQAGAETDADRAATAWLRAGQLALEAADSVGARADLWAALEHERAGQAAREAARLLDRLPGSAGDDDTQIRLGRALLASGAWEPAYTRLRPYLDTTPNALPLDDEVRLELGRGLVDLRRYGEAEALLAPLVAGDIGTEMSTQALYWTGRAELGRGAIERAEATFKLLAQTDPDSYLAEQGLYLLLSRELETGFGPRARGFLDDLLSVGVRDSEAGAAVVRLGTTELLSRDYPSATTVFDRYLDGSRSASQRQQAGYWAALTREQAGEPVRSQALLEEVHSEEPLTFYGMLAGERLGAPVFAPDLPPGPPPLGAGRTELESALLRLRVLRLVPTTGSFTYELDRLTRRFATVEDGDYAFAEALSRGGFPLQAIVLGREIEAREGAWNLRLLHIVYPFLHRDEIVRLAAENGLDPFFVAGVIRQESAWDAGIRSVAGATGLMQLMPATAQEVAQSLRIAYSPEALTDPETNLRLGITYLASMVRRFDRAEDVLSAYNAGPGRMRQWQSDPTHVDRDVFIENIPFAQTRDYVKGVQRYTRVYTALYGCGDFQPCLGLPYLEVVARSPLARGAPRTERTLD